MFKPPEAFKLFYTQEEMVNMTKLDIFKYRLWEVWYNFSEWFLTLKESDNRWMNRDV
jgi:hypothetical protein